MKKFTVNSLAFGTLKARKKQYTLMIIGVVFAMIFSSAVLLFLDCMKASSEELTKQTYGSQDFLAYNVDETEITKLDGSRYITPGYGLCHIVGFAYTQEDELNQGSSVSWLDDKAAELSGISFIEGRYPENENEIAFEKATLRRLLGSETKLGDQVTLSVLTPTDRNSYMSDSVKKTYTLVGIAKDKAKALSVDLPEKTSYSSDSDENRDTNLRDQIPSIFVCRNSKPKIGGKERLAVYGLLNQAIKNKYDAFHFLENTLVKDADSVKCGMIFTDMFSTYSGGSDSSDRHKLMSSALLSVVLSVVLLLASCMGIISSMDNNISDRKKQIGMYRTVGATRRQIINIFGREALIICLICSPISVLVSYFSVKIIASLLGDMFIFKPRWIILALCCAFGIASVMLASFIPLLKASSISPVQSIRNINLTRKMNRKHIKTQKSYDPVKLVANRNKNFNRKSQVLISILIVITICGSCVACSFLEALIKDTYQTESDYILFAGYTDSDYLSDAERQKILKTGNVKTFDFQKNYDCVLDVGVMSDYTKTVALGDILDINSFEDAQHLEKLSPEDFDKEINSYFSADYLAKRENYNDGRDYLNTTVTNYSKEMLEELEKYVIDGKLDYEKLNAGEEIIMLAPKRIAYLIQTDSIDDGWLFGSDANENILSIKNYLKVADCDFHAGDYVKLSKWETDSTKSFNRDDETSLAPLSGRTDVNIRIGAIIRKEMRWDTKQIYSGNQICFTTTTDGFASIFPEENSYSAFFINVCDDCKNEEDDKEMMSLLDSMTFSKERYAFSQYAHNLEEQEINMTFLVSLLSVLILFFSISAVVINNSLSARIRESKREIGTMRAVGATRGDIVMSFIRQLLSTISASYVASLIIIVLSVVIKFAVEKRLGIDLEFSIHLWPAIAVSAVLFVICSFNLWLKVRKEMKTSIIDNIREL